MRHPRAGLGPEILDDDFLQMPVRRVQIAQRQQGFDPFAPRLADANQNPGRERHLQFAGHADGCQAFCRLLVGRSEMRPSPLRQSLRGAFQHHALRDRDLAQGGKIGGLEQTRIDVRQQAGFLEHEAGHLRQIGQGRLMPQAIERLARGAVAQFRLVAEREQSLGTSGRLSGARNLQDLVAR